jgi:integrase
VPEQVESGRAIENVEQVINNIYDTRFESGVIADVQHELGLRVAEAHELVNNHGRYINDDKVEGLVGKGNHIYHEKEISQELIAKIEQCQEIPSVRTYQDDISKEDISSHDFRYTFAKEHEHDMTKEELSRALNHEREEMTNYYLARV